MPPNNILWEKMSIHLAKTGIVSLFKCEITFEMHRQILNQDYQSNYKNLVIYFICGKDKAIKPPLKFRSPWVV